MDMQLFYYVILQDHVIIWSSDWMDRNHRRLVIMLPSFLAISIVVVEMQLQWPFVFMVKR